MSNPMPDQKDKNTPIPDYGKINLLKCVSLQSTIKKLNKEKESLINETIKLSKENSDLKTVISKNLAFEQEIKSLRERINILEKEKEDEIKNYEKIISKLKQDIICLEKEKEFNKLQYTKENEIFQQKLEVVNFVEKENKIYAEEITALRKDQEKYRNEKEKELKQQKINNMLKFDRIKKKMIDSLTKSNEDAKKLNSEYNTVTYKQIILQNQQLLLQIQSQKKRTKDLEQEIKRLTQELYKNESEINIHKLVEQNLAKKIIKRINRSDMTIRNNDNSQKKYTMKKNSSDILCRSKNINEIYNLGDKKNYSTGQFTSVKTPNYENKLLNFQKELHEKEMEIEKGQIVNLQLKNKLNIYKDKFKGLYDFLEENLELFSKDEKIISKTNYNSKTNKIRNCNFEDFNVEEKKELLEILMKYLLPLANPEIDYSNVLSENKTFFNMSKGFITTKARLNDSVLRKAFVNKSNRFHQDIMTGKTLISHSPSNVFYDNKK